MPDNRRILKRLSTGLIVVVFASLALERVSLELLQ